MDEYLSPTHRTRQLGWDQPYLHGTWTHNAGLACSAQMFDSLRKGAHDQSESIVYMRLGNE